MGRGHAGGRTVHRRGGIARASIACAVFVFRPILGLNLSFLHRHQFPWQLSNLRVYNLQRIRRISCSTSGDVFSKPSGKLHNRTGDTVLLDWHLLPNERFRGVLQNGGVVEFDGKIVGCSDPGIVIGPMGTRYALEDLKAVRQPSACDWRSAVPQPGISAMEAVEIQLKALQENDPLKGDGIAKVFEFSSLNNLAATGPLPRFEKMIRTTFACMLNSFDFYIVSASHVQPNSCEVRVRVVASKSTLSGARTFRWLLSDDGSGWRTDRVRLLDSSALSSKSSLHATIEAGVAAAVIAGLAALLGSELVIVNANPVSPTFTTVVETRRMLADGSEQTVIERTTQREVRQAGIFPKARGDIPGVAASQNWRTAVPRPGMNAIESVVTQLQALQENNPFTNDGIAKVFEFAAPGNQEATGPLPRFADMIRNGYACMLNSASFSVLSAESSDDSCVVLVKVSGSAIANGEVRVFRWALSDDGRGWRTESVVPDIGPW